MMPHRKLMVILGPTASGKTALSVALARKENTVVVSADSRQFYREMNIGTAKPSIQEMQRVPHYFINSHSIHDPITAARFAVEAEQLLHELFPKYPTIILTGGSGLFVDALCCGIDNIPHDPIVQQQLNNELQLYGIEKLLIELKQADFVYFQQVDKNNPRRIIRALEAIRLTKRPYSELRNGQVKKHAFNIEYFVIDIPREQLYQRINSRVDKMIANGLEQEALSLFPFRHLKPLQTVGYTEWFDVFEGKIDKLTCIDRIKQNTRRYAKRQITWLKRYQNKCVIDDKNIEMFGF